MEVPMGRDSAGLRGLGDVLLDRKARKDQVHAALCTLLALPPAKVGVVRSYEELVARHEPVLVLCRVIRLGGGEFPTLLSATGGVLIDLPRIGTATRLCRLLRCRCLLDDGSVNPYTFLQVDASGACLPVAVDADRWGRNEYVVARSGPTS
jgi:hypothetical protein